MFSVSVIALVACVGLFLAPAGAATIEIFPSNADGSCKEEFVIRANALQPGDVLILHGGTYTQTCRRAITVNGTADNPITISPGFKPSGEIDRGSPPASR